MAAEFDVSRSPVREALKILATENMIRLERMGAVVVGLTGQDISSKSNTFCSPNEAIINKYRQQLSIFFYICFDRFMLIPTPYHFRNDIKRIG